MTMITYMVVHGYAIQWVLTGDIQLLGALDIDPSYVRELRNG